MLLAIDVGNTNIVLALFEGAEMRAQWRVATRTDRTADEYALAIIQFMELEGLKRDTVKAAIISSVVPSVMFPLTRCMRDYFSVDALAVGDPSVKIGMDVRIDRPQEAGADRLVNAFAARETYGNNLLILDFGTATTFDLVDQDGAYAGGVIAPGINLSLEALHRAAAKLPLVAVARPAKVIGTGTVGAMQSGIYYGYLSLIEGIIARIEAEHGHPLKVIATGGLAPLFVRATPAIHHRDEDLTLRGLQRIYALNQ